MIKKSIITAIVLLLLHALLIPNVRSLKRQGQHQLQNNIIRAQQFLYDETGKYEVAIVGSSLSGRLKLDSTPNAFNLSFGGGSIFDGFKVLEKQSALPHSVFVEPNLIMRKENSFFTDATTSFLPLTLKRYFPSLRDENQPVFLVGNNLAIPLVNRLFDWLQSVRYRWYDTSKPLTNDAVPANNQADARNRLLQRLADANARPPDENILRENLDLVRKWVEFLEKRNVTVVFYEMPGDPAFCNLLQPKRIREAFGASFPTSEYHYIAPVSCDGYSTTDGAHLDENAARKYSSHFLKEAARWMARKSVVAQ